MRIGLIAATALVWLLLGATCIPIADTTGRSPLGGQSLIIDLLTPAAAASVKQGDDVQIKWTAANMTGNAAKVSLTAESRTDLSRSTLVEDLPVEGTSGSGTFIWQTADYAGPYAIIARIETSSDSYEMTSSVLTTIVAPPTLEFTAPTSDTNYTLGQTSALTIEWIGGGTSAKAYIGLDPDLDHGNDPTSTDTDRNEIYLDVATLPWPAASGSFDFKGKDKDSNAVSAGTYYLFATLTDGVNSNVVVDATARVIVLANPESNPAVAVTEPSTDTTFMTTDASLTIETTYNQSSDVLVDLKIDTDDNHSNGNEQTILSQRLIAAGTDSDTFAWTGTNSAGGAVADGIYRVFATASTGSGTPSTGQATGLVFRRSSAEQPLIALIVPNATQTVEAGSYVTIQWRDDLPDVTGTDTPVTAKVRLTIDDDPTPNQGELGSTTDMAELEILSGRDAGGSTVQHTFSWQVPSSLAAGTYYIFAYIDRDSVAPWDNISVAGGRVVVKDVSTSTQ